MLHIVKRDGRTLPFEVEKIDIAVQKAFAATIAVGEWDGGEHAQLSAFIAENVESKLDSLDIGDTVDIEMVQDYVEREIMLYSPAVAKAYILYREERNKDRDSGSRIMQTLSDIAFSSAKDSDIKRENANIDGDTAMGTMLKFGSESAKLLTVEKVLSKAAAAGHKDGDFHIHDMDFLLLTLTCCQIDLTKLFKGGFSTGHGFLREPNDISTYAALAAIIIQANQNDMHGGQGIPHFDYDMAEGVRKTLLKEFASALTFALQLSPSYQEDEGLEQKIRAFLKNEDFTLENLSEGTYRYEILLKKLGAHLNLELDVSLIETAGKVAIKRTDKKTHQAMEGFVHNMNTMHSRAGAQVPFSSINYGTDTSLEGRMVIKNIMLATREGLGKGETPVFPIQIFKCKSGVNFNVDDPNYDLFVEACKTSATRMFPNFSFLDAPFNLQHYVKGDKNSEVTYMGCRTRVIANVYDPTYEKSSGRGNLSFTTVNLPRLAIELMDNNTLKDDKMRLFYSKLHKVMDVVLLQLLERYEIQARKKIRNFPFLMGQGVWHDSENLLFNDEIREVIKHGTLSIGFIGLAETLIALTGKHHGESKESQALGLEIIQFMRDFCDKKSQKLKMNVTLIATPAEGLSGRFIKIDREKYGEIAHITDKEYYTNSFHVPVYYDINAFDKITTEAPYHALTNAGHITYVELDGDPTKNIDAFISVIKHMGASGIGYGAINHPIDRDPICGHNGIIDNECPKCGRTENPGEPFERIRRITGYLVGSLDRFNDAKRAEERDRKKHGFSK